VNGNTGAVIGGCRAAILGLILIVASSSFVGSATVIALDRVEHHNAGFKVLHVDLRTHALELYWKDEEGQPLGTFARLHQYLDRHNRRLLFATNAGIYDPGLVPHGLHVQQGRQLTRINRRGIKCTETSNFHMKPNGVFFIGKDGARVVETETYDERTVHPYLATQSGPLLVLDNEINPCFRKSSSSTHIRNAVGVRTPEDIYIAISETPVNLYTMASFFKEVLRCPNALYLDGAISSVCIDCVRDERFRYAGMLAVVDQDDRR
jgi:uncharacterized protein YigE (DUF2233 family)